MKDERDIFHILEGHEEAPSAQAWNKLEKRLGPDRERKAVYWRVAAAIALLLVGSGAYFWGFQRPGTTEGTVAINKASKVATKSGLSKESPVIARSQREAEAAKQPGSVDQSLDQTIASVEPAQPSSVHIQARKVTKGLPRMKRQLTAPEKGIANQGSASIATVDKVTKDNNVTEETGQAPEPQIAQAPQNGRALPEALKAPVQEIHPSQVAQAELPKTEETVAHSVAYTMEIKSSRNEEEDDEEEADSAPRPLLYRLVKSANDVASGKVRGKDLVNKGSTAVNSFLHRDRNHNADKDNN